MGIPRRQERLRGRHAYVDGIRFVMPVDSRNSSAMIAAFSINWEKARALIPPGDVHPFRLWKRGLLVVTVIDYRDTDIGAYIEYSLAIACTKGAAPAPRLLPGALMGFFGTGQYVFDLPVSTEISVKGGKGIWGMPKQSTSSPERAEYSVPGGIRAFGRCIGHGGMPVDLPPAQPKHPECAVEFIDDRPYPNDENLTVGFNGFARIRLDGNRMTVNYVDVDGAVIFSESWIVESGVLRRVESTHL